MRDSKNSLNFVYTFRTYILIMFTTFSTACIPMSSNLRVGVFDQSFGGYSRPVGNVAFSCQNKPPRHKMMKPCMVHKLG
jgi:hypothetical protein